MIQFQESIIVDPFDGTCSYSTEDAPDIGQTGIAINRWNGNLDSNGLQVGLMQPMSTLADPEINCSLIDEGVTHDCSTDQFSTGTYEVALNGTPRSVDVSLRHGDTSLLLAEFSAFFDIGMDPSDNERLEVSIPNGVTFYSYEPEVNSVVFQNSGGGAVSTVDPGDAFRVQVTFGEAMDPASTPTIDYYMDLAGSGAAVDLSSWFTGGNWSSGNAVYTFRACATWRSAGQTAIGRADRSRPELDQSLMAAGPDPIRTDFPTPRSLHQSLRSIA